MKAIGKIHVFERSPRDLLIDNGNNRMNATNLYSSTEASTANKTISSKNLPDWSAHDSERVQKLQIPVKRYTTNWLDEYVTRSSSEKKGGRMVSERTYVQLPLACVVCDCPLKARPESSCKEISTRTTGNRSKYVPYSNHQGSARSPTSSARRSHHPHCPRPRRAQSQTRSRSHLCAPRSHSHHWPFQVLDRPSAAPTAAALPTVPHPPDLRHRRVQRGTRRRFCSLGWGRTCRRRVQRFRGCGDSCSCRRGGTGLAGTTCTGVLFGEKLRMSVR